jgi:hypothetical protein
MSSDSASRNPHLTIVSRREWLARTGCGFGAVAAAFVRLGKTPAQFGVGTTIDAPEAGVLSRGGTFPTCRR